MLKIQSIFPKTIMLKIQFIYPKKVVAYVHMLNIYEKVGRWDEVVGLRSIIVSIQLLGIISHLNHSYHKNQKPCLYI